MKIKKETIIRLIVLTIVLVNQILCSTGVLNFELAETEVYEYISLIFTLGASFWTAWKNNSITQNAIKSDEYLEKLRSGEDVI